jgi:hypothetical protein
MPVRFAPDKRHSEDYLLWLEAALAGGTLLFMDRPLVFFFKPSYGDSGLSKDPAAMQKGETDVFLRLHRKGLLPGPAAAAALGWSLVKYLRRLAFLELGVER